MKKVILLGDSIRLIGYGLNVPALLGDGFSVWQPEDNGRYSVYTLHAILHYWLNELDGADVIHWNNGIWDVQIGADGEPLIPIREYVAVMCRIADILKKKCKVLIFASTTPVLDARPDIRNADIERYNAALIPELRQKGVLINDLYAVVSENPDRFLRKDDFTHLTEAGITACAERTAAVIRENA